MQITLTFTEPLNNSLQVGDTVWYIEVSQAGGYDTGSLSNLKRLGIVEELSHEYRRSEVIISNSTSPSTPNITIDTFIMFSKDNKANLSSLVGYYAEANFRNDSSKKVELYTVSSEVVQSSK